MKTVIRSTSISNTLKLATTLRFLAQGSYQSSFRNDFNVGLSQPTVTLILNETLDVLNRTICPLIIKLDLTEEEKLECKLNFFQKTGFPGVIGCVGGDVDYLLEPYLMTPYRSAQERSPLAVFNSKHASATNIIERTIGVLKNRFRDLLGARQLHYKPDKANKTVIVYAALHNICIEYRSYTEDYDRPANTESITKSFATLSDNPTNNEAQILLLELL